MLADSITITDGAIKAGVIESGAEFPGVGNTKSKKKGQLYYLDQKINDKAAGLYVFDGAEWVPSSSDEAASSAGDAIDESALWMGA